jgi:hypothetical protein
MLALLQPVWRVASFGAFAALLVPFQILAHAAEPEMAVRPPTMPAGLPSAADRCRMGSYHPEKRTI